MKGKIKTFSWWKKTILIVLVIVLLIIAAFLVYNWFAYSFTKLHTTQSDESYEVPIPYDISKVPDKTDYIGTVEIYSYTKLIPIPIICGDCFGEKGYYDWQSMKTGKCCYLIVESIGEDHFYQTVEVHVTVKKPELILTDITNLTVLKDLIPEDCESMNYNQNCYYELAKRLKNPLLCNKIRHEDTRNRCIIRAARNIEDCETLKMQGLKQDCYRHLAINLKDISLCDKIEEGFWKESCKNAVISGWEEKL